MKIENIKINSFGKINNKEYNLYEKINLIYGKNETGKSTLLKFIQNIFYGTSKNKKGKYFSDYDLYKPWGEGDFSGKIKYKLDSGEKFEVYREFGKKNPKIYNEKLEDISKEFNIDKNTGSEFFFEQTKVDEFMFLSSIVSMQQEVKLNKQDQNIYIQKIVNLAGTGDDNVSYKKAIDKLNKKQLDEIGTDRSQGKPINLSINKINKYENEIKELENYKQKKYIIEDEINKLNNEIEKEKLKEKYLKELKEKKEIEKIEIEKINLNKRIIEKNEELIKEKHEELNLLLIQREKNNNIEN
ncbi:MAG: AAA family ATPase, partial [Clostridia bacterium]|nr:AAA family ATPase [Clostridia bacterium]